MAGEVTVEEDLRRRKRQDAGLAEALEGERVELCERDRLRQLQLPLVGGERVLVELGHVGQEALGAGQAVRVGRGRAGQPTRHSRPVVVADEGGGELLPLESELCLGELRHRRRLLEEEPVNPLEHAAHPLVQLGRADLAGREEVEDLLRVVQLK